MSLSRLNDQLKADICSFLDIKNINKLAQVNTRIKASLQRRGLAKVRRLWFERERNEQWSFRKWTCLIELHSDSEYPNERTTVAEFDEGMNSAEVLNCINKFKTIEYLELRDIILQDNAGWEDIAAKIRSVELIQCDITMSKETVLKFFKKFDEVAIGDGCDMGPVSITDEFHIELARVGTTVHYMGDFDRVVAVTDATLDAISSITVPKELYLKGLITGITFARVKKMMEDVLKSEITNMRYDFGYLKNDQYDEAHRFMSEEFEIWAEGFDRWEEESDGSLSFNCFNEKDRDGYDYESFTISSEDLSFFVEFGVYREEIPENDNDGEEESSDESGDDSSEEFSDESGDEFSDESGEEFSDESGDKAD